MYKPINDWTKQRMLEHVKREFKGKSIHQNGCAYRGLNGAKCAVGMFIPDELYDPMMDYGSQNNVDYLLSKYTELEKIMPLEYSGLSLLQKAHDRSMDYACLSNIIQWIDKNVSEE